MKKSLFVGCLVFLMAGCSGQKPSSTATRTDNAANSAQLAQTKQSTKNLSAAQNNVQLVSQGSEPRQELRFTPPVNAKQTVEMTMNVDITMSARGQTQTSNFPPMKLTMQTEVAKVDENGDIHTNFSYTDADIITDGKNIPPQVLEATRSQLSKLVGSRGSMVVDNRGNAKEVKLDVSETLDPNSKQILQQAVNSFKQISSPVPNEPVGVGATWKVPNKVTLNGMTLNQVATYELVDLKDNVATLEVSVEQQAEGGLKPQGLPPGASIDSMNAIGQGKTTIALNKIVPTNSNVSVTSNIAMKVKDPNNQQEVPMEMRSTAEVSVESN